MHTLPDREFKINAESSDTTTSLNLARNLGLTALVIYGVGDILGAGIYALIGKVTGYAGSYTWLSFAIAMGIVFLTALNYSELSSRYPQSGGVSIYVQKAFQKEWFSLFVAFLLFSATVLSMATLSQAAVGYVKSFGWEFPNWIGVVVFLFILMMINLRGIKQSSIANIISTSIELFGLIIVLVCSFWYFFGDQHSLGPQELPSFKNLLQGAALAFFAFTGFEDIANVAEEVQHPKKNLPRGILSAIGFAGVLYLAISWAATAVVPGDALSRSNAPLLTVVKTAYPAFSGFVFTIIALFAISNTVLLNYVTASRLLYGMAKINLLPKVLKRVHKKYRTPYAAIFFVLPFVFALTLVGSLEVLASSTSAVVLIVFSLSGLALIKIKYSEMNHPEPHNHFKIPIVIPILAVLCNLVVICYLPLRSLIPALGLIAFGTVLIGIFLFERRKKN